MSATQFSYVAKRRACGCTLHAIPDRTEEPGWRASIAQDVAAWIRSGLIVERIPSAEAVVVRCRCGESGRFPGMEE